MTLGQPMRDDAWGISMKRTVTAIRCMPRFGYDFAEVRTVDLDLPPGYDETLLRVILERYFNALGVHDAVYDIDVDNYGFFAIINDEAYYEDWGRPLL